MVNVTVTFSNSTYHRRVTSVGFGDSLIINPAPIVGYHVADILLDGEQSLVREFVRWNITVTHTSCIIALTRIKYRSFKVRVEQYPGPQLCHGGEKTFSVTPAVGYHIDSVLVDGINAGHINYKM